MRYKVLQPVEFAPGSVFRGLSVEQLRRRASFLRILEGGLAEAVQRVQFKAGELVEYDGDVPKTWLGSKIEPVTPDAPVQRRETLTLKKK